MAELSGMRELVGGGHEAKDRWPSPGRDSRAPPAAHFTDHVLMSERAHVPGPKSTCALFIAFTCTPRMQRPLSERAPYAGTVLLGSSSRGPKSSRDQIKVDCHLRKATRTAGRVGDTASSPPAPTPFDRRAAHLAWMHAHLTRKGLRHGEPWEKAPALPVSVTGRITAHLADQHKNIRDP